MSVVVSLLLARNVSRLRADVPAFEAEKRTSSCQPDTRPGPAGRTRLELLGAELLMQIEIRHRCGRRADLPHCGPRMLQAAMGRMAYVAWRKALRGTTA